MTGRVIHVSDMAERGGTVDGAVYIGRAMSRRRLKASIWANPYKIGKPSVLGGPILSREEVIANYSSDLDGPNRHLLADLPALRGKPLACWCRHDGDPPTEVNACHGDVLIDLLDRFTDDELRRMALDEEA